MHLNARISRLGAVTAALAAALALSTAATASAEGTSFATATPVQYGAAQFGNAAPDSSECWPWSYRFWALSVAAGDRITVSIQGAWAQAEVWPVGTDDFNTDVQSSDYEPFRAVYPQSNQKARLRFSANRTGTMPFVVMGDPCSDNGRETAGPYDFVATVEHGLRLGMWSTGKRIGRRFTATFSVATPEGAPITDPALLVQLQAKLRGRWVTLGSAPAQQGAAGILGKLPRSTRGKKVKLRGRAQADGYLTAVSAVRTVRVK